jgi:predicted RNA-binding protein with PUA-like domain
MVNYWLVKQEPSGPRGYNFANLQKDKKTVWDGVHNNLALKHMGNMKKGDLAFFYHTGDEKQIVGIITITSAPYPNSSEDNKRFIVIDVKFNKKLKNPISLEEIKKFKKFKNWELLRISRLSVMPVPKEIWTSILQMSKK